MSVLFISGGELGTLDEWTSETSTSASTSQKHSGIYSLHPSGGGAGFEFALTEAELRVRCWVYFVTTINGSIRFNAGADDGRIDFNADGSISAIAMGGTSDTSSTGLLTTGTWIKIDVRYKKGTGSDAECEARISGAIEATSVDGTQTADITRLDFASNSQSNNIFFDDILVTNDISGWPPDGENHALRPNGDDNTDWSASDSSSPLWEIVNNNPASDDPYVHEDGTAGPQFFDYDDSAVSGADTYNFGILHTRMERSGGQGREHSIVYAEAGGSPTENSGDLNLTTSWVHYQFNVTGAAEPANIADLADDIIGPNQSASAGMEGRCSEVWFVVDVTVGGAVELTESHSDDIDNYLDAFVKQLNVVLLQVHADALTTPTDALALIFEYRYDLAENTNNYADATALLYHRDYVFADSNIVTDATRVVLGREYLFADSITILTDALELKLTVNETLVVADALTPVTDTLKVVYGREYPFADTIVVLTDAHREIYSYLYDLADDTDNYNDAHREIYCYLYDLADDIDNYLDALATDLQTSDADKTLVVADDIDNWGDNLELCFGYSFFDTNVATDDDREIYGRNYAFADSITVLTDALEIQLFVHLERTFADSITIVTDSLDRLILEYRYILADDTDNYADALRQIYGRNYSFTEDTDNYADANVIRYNFLIPFGDQYSITDSLLDNVGYFTSFSDSYTITDTFNLGYGLPLSASDSITIVTDAFASSVESPPLEIIESEDIDNFLDAFTFIFDGRHFADDTDNYADALITHINSLHFIGDTIDNWADALEIAMELTLVVTDGIPAFTDQLGGAFPDVVIQADSINNLSDTFASTISGVPVLDLNEDIDNFNDALLMTMVMRLDLGDLWNSVFDDEFLIILELQLDLSDSYTITDATAIGSGLELELSVSDSINNLMDAIANESNTRGVGVSRGATIDYIRRYLNDVVPT